MNPQWLTAIVAGLGVLGQIGLAAYFWGRLSRAVAEHDKRFDKQDVRFDGHDDDSDAQWRAISQTREDVGKLQGHTGINGGGPRR